MNYGIPPHSTSSTANNFWRLVLIGVVLSGIIGLFSYAGGWLTPHALSPRAMVNTFEQVNGRHSGFRRNHAKGVCVSGYFESNGNGTNLSRALVFKPGRVPVVGRFALAGGQPYQADGAHTVRSMALLFKQSNGEEWRTGMNNIPVFAVNSAQGFHDLLIASAPDKTTGKPDPANMKSFQSKHPESAKAMELIHLQKMSSGFANSTFNSLNTFRFSNAQGQITFVRWSMVPFEAFEPVEHSEAGRTNYLFDSLIAKIRNQPLRWHLIVNIAEAGYAINDATIPWPPGGRQVDLGTLTIDQVQSEDTSPVRDINFDPLILPDGISGSDDPLLSARSAAYSQSLTRRDGERKSPSAVSPVETGGSHE